MCYGLSTPMSQFRISLNAFPGAAVPRQILMPCKVPGLLSWAHPNDFTPAVASAVSPWGFRKLMTRKEQEAQVHL